MSESTKPPRGLYWSSRDIKNLQRNADGLPAGNNRRQRLEDLVTTKITPGEAADKQSFVSKKITYVGRLALEIVTQDDQIIYLNEFGEQFEPGT